MSDKDRRTSKFLSLVLRHQPELIGLRLDEAGWVPVAELLEGCRRAGQAITLEELKEIVRTSDKQRFALSEDGTRIRANQGHSIDVDLGLEPASPPAVLFHGTVERFLPAIRREGLRPMSRHDVHLSADQETATRVGARRGKPVVLTVDAAGMSAAGHTFRISANGVWLVAAVPPEYLR